MKAPRNVPLHVFVELLGLGTEPTQQHQCQYLLFVVKVCSDNWKKLGSILCSSGVGTGDGVMDDVGWGKFLGFFNVKLKFFLI